MIYGIVLLLVVPLFAELVARRWIRTRNEHFVWQPGLRMRIEPDREVCPQFERTTRFEVNSDGERGDEPPRQCAGLYRVLVAGGSQPEGYLLDQDTSWPGALQRLLATPDHLQQLGAARVHVGCIARSGVGTEALALILGRILPRYKRLNTIIVIVGASDVLRWLEEGAPAAPARPVTVADVFRCHPETRYGWHPKKTAFFDLVRRWRLRWLRPLEVQRHAGRWIVKARAMRLQANILDSVPSPEPMLDHFDVCFRRAIRLAKAHADRVIVVRQPWSNLHGVPAETPHIWNGGLGRAWQEHVTTFVSLTVLTRLMGVIDARAAAAAEELEVEQVDLMPLLEPTLDNYYDCFHPTPAGSAIVAKAVAAAVLREEAAGRITQPAGKPRVRLTPVPEMTTCG